jgi:hypothetical protein
MKQQNEMSARALTMEEMENVNGGIPSLMRQILKDRQFNTEAFIK